MIHIVLQFTYLSTKTIHADTPKKGPQEIRSVLFRTHIADFNLSGGCFGTEIIQNYTKWSNIGVHGLSFGPIEAEFQGASFLIRKNAEK